MANLQIFDFKIIGLSEIPFWVLKWRCLNYKLDEDYEIYIDLMIPQSWAADLLGSVCGKLGQLITQYTLLNGFVQSCLLGKMIGVDKQQVTLKLSSPLSPLKKNIQSRIFRKTTIKNLVERILTENNWEKSSYQFKPVNTNFAVEPWMLQHKESDYLFLKRYLAKNHLAFTFDHTEQSIQWVIFDPNHYFPNNSIPYLECIEPKGMGFHIPAVIKIHYSTSLTSVLSNAIEITTDAIGLVPGQALELRDNNVATRSIFSGNYRVIGLELMGDQSAGFPEWGTEIHSQSPIDFVAKATLLPIHETYRPNYVPRRDMNGLLLAKIAENNLDDEGNYFVNFPWDHTNEHLNASVPRIQPFAGTGFGCHLPIKAPTEVGVAWVEGNGEQPIVMGVLPNLETPSPVNDKEPFMHRFYTSGDTGIHFSDLQGSEKIEMHTALKQNLLLLDTTNNKHQIQLCSAIGSIHFKAKVKVIFNTGEQQFQQIKGNVSINVISNSKKEVKQNISIETHQNFNFKTSQDFLMQAESNLSCAAKEAIRLYSAKNLNFLVKTKDAVVTATEVTIRSHNGRAVFRSIKGNSGKSCLQLKIGEDSFMQARDGNLWAKFDKMSLKAKAIYMPARGEFTV